MMHREVFFKFFTHVREVSCIVGSVKLFRICLIIYEIHLQVANRGDAFTFSKVCFLTWLHNEAALHVHMH